MTKEKRNGKGEGEGVATEERGIRRKGGQTDKPRKREKKKSRKADKEKETGEQTDSKPVKRK